MGDFLDVEFSLPQLSASDVVNRNAPTPQPPPQQQRATAVAPPAKSTTAPVSRAGGNTEVDHSFLDGLSNKRKTKSNRAKAGGFMRDHDDLDLYDEDNELARRANAERIERMKQLRKEAEAEQMRQQLPPPLDVAGPSQLPPPSQRNALDDATFASIMGAKTSGGKSRSSRRLGDAASVVSSSGSSATYHRRRREGGGTFDAMRPPDSFGDDAFGGYGDDEDMPPRKTAAELLLEERQYKARRVARIEQLESKGIKCSLPDDVDWMSLPLSQIDDALLLMDTMYKRKGRILKMRAGFYGLNKALVWGATNHPGPEFLKFYKVKGFDKTIASEIDEFDDDLEKLYEMWFGESGEMHPLMSILLIEATMLGNHVMKQSGDGDVLAKVSEPGAAKGNGSASQSNLMTNMLSMLSNNPAMSGAVQSVMGAAAATTPPAQQQHQGQAPPYIRQQPQQQQAPPAPPAHIFQVRDYGAPPASSGSNYDPATAREFQIRDNQLKQLEERLKQQTQETAFVREQATNAAASVRTLPNDDTEELRLLMDSLVTSHVDESAAAPADAPAPAAADDATRPASLTVQMPAPTGRRGGARGGRGGRRGGG